MSDLDKWKGKTVRLRVTVQAQVMIAKRLVTEEDDWRRKKPRKLNLMKGEVFTVVGHYDGKLDLLYQPQKVAEKLILHVPTSALETFLNGHPIH